MWLVQFKFLYFFFSCQVQMCEHEKSTKTNELFVCTKQKLVLILDILNKKQKIPPVPYKMKCSVDIQRESK